MKRRKTGRRHKQMGVNVVISLIVTIYLAFVIVGNFFVSKKLKTSFQTLAQVTAYAKETDEFPEIDNNDRWKPDYSSYYAKITPGFHKRLLYKAIPILPRSKWQPEPFKDLLNKVTKQQEELGYLGNHILKLTLKPNSNIVIFGDLQGAFHSFVRDIEKLKSLDIINNKFEIIKPNHFIIFNGDLVNRSPYILETLSIALLLMQKNPGKVFYNRGNNESEDHMEFGIAKELQYKANAVSNENIPLKMEILKFFNTLPLAIFISIPKTPGELFSRISHIDSTENDKLEEINFSDFLNQKGQGLQKFKFDQQRAAPQKEFIQLGAVIKGVPQTYTANATNGLSLLPQEKGATTWCILSCPTSSYKILHDFYYDAFCILSTDANFDCTLTLYNQDSRTKSGFHKTSFDFFNGTEKTMPSNAIAPISQTQTASSITPQPTSTNQAPPPQQSATTPPPLATSKEIENIKVGCVYGASGGIIEVHTKKLEGLKLGIDSANKILTNKKITLFAYDHQYEPKIATTKVLQLFNENKVQLLLSPMGSDIRKFILPIVKEKESLVLFPIAVEKPFENEKPIFFLAPSFEEEARKLVEYALNDLTAKKIALFYQDDLYGKGPLNASLKLLKERKIPDADILSIGHARNSTDIVKQAAQLNKFQPNCILFFSTMAASTALINKLDLMRHINFFGISAMNTISFKKFLNEKEIRFTWTHVVPNINDTTLEITKDYVNDTKKANLTPEDISFEGYIVASIFADVVKQINPPTTNNKIVAKLESLKNYNFKGLTLNFDPKTRELTRNIWIESINGKWIYSPIKEPEASPAKKETTLTKDGDEIKIGTILDLSAGSFEIGNSALDAMKFVINKTNNAGGIRGKKISLTALDHQYDGLLAKKHVQQLLKDNIDIILMILETTPLKSCLDFIKDKKILVLFPNSGASVLRKPEYSNLIFYKTSYESEAIVAADYAVNELLSKKIAIFYIDDGSLDDTMQAFIDRLNKNNFTGKIISTPYQANSADVKKAAEEIKKFSPDTLYLLSDPIPTTSLFSKLGYSWLAQKNLIGINILANSSFYKITKENGLSVNITHVIPNFQKSTIALMQEFVEITKKYSVPANDFALQGYIGASILVDVLKQIDEPITKEKIISKIESFKNYDLKGLKLNFDPQTRELNKDIWIEKANGDWIYSPVKEPEAKPASQPEAIKANPEIVTTTPAQIQPKTEELKIGTMVDFVGVAKDHELKTLEGLKLRVTKANTSNELNNLKIKLVALDHEYQPQIAFKQIQKLFEQEKIDILVAPAGTMTLKFCLDYIKKNSILTLFPGSGSAEFRTPANSNLIFAKASYEDEAEALTKYAIDNVLISKMALFFQDDSYGRGPLAATETVMKQKNFTKDINWLEVPNEGASTNVANAVKTINEFNANALFLFAITTPSLSLLSGVKTQASQFVFGLSPLCNATFSSYTKSKGIRTILAHTAPNNTSTKLEIFDEYAAELKKNNIELDDYILEGYIAISILIEAIKQIDRPVTKEKIKAKIESFNNYKFKGLNLTFDPKTRNLLKDLWLETETGSWIPCS